MKTPEMFSNYGIAVQTPDGILITPYDSNSPNKVLAIAHLDTVQQHDFFKRLIIEGEEFVMNSKLDNRLGVYIITELLPSLGIKCDILLTDSEETMRSTGQYFFPTKQYNWMFSFDRRAEDVVSYMYETDDLNKKLTSAGFKIGVGSCSDISFMEHLGITGINFGNGVMKEHSKYAMANLEVLRRQVTRFMKFYKSYKNIKMPYTPKPALRFAGYGWKGDMGSGFGDRWNDDWNDYGKLSVKPTNSDVCEFCERKLNTGEKIVSIELNRNICQSCLHQSSACAVCCEITLDTELVDDICSDCAFKYDTDEMMNPYDDN